MTRPVYPLNSLRAFEAAARHLSFVKASEELFVTPAAVSHQVKRLEEYLGLQLFRRLSRGLLLSETGQLLSAELREVFLHLDMAMAKVVETDSQGALTISVAPMFAAKWLLPRLQNFELSHPDIDLRMSSTLALVDFQRDGIDAAIRLGHGSYPGLDAVKLFEESVTPMCSPRLLKGKRTLTKPDELQGQVLLHDDSLAFDAATPNWRNWLKAANINTVDISRGIHFGQPDHALQAAIDGAGVVLGWRNLAAADIAAGRLVTPFELSLPLGAAFYLVYPQAYANRKKVEMLREWVLKQIDSDSTEESGTDNDYQRI